MRLLVGAALLALAAAAVLLALGWSDTNESLIWASIGASALCVAALTGAYLRARRATIVLPERVRAEEPEPTAGLAALPILEPDPAPGPPLVPAAPEPSPADPEVVAIPERRKYHRPDCRYAKAKGAERMARSAARRRRFTACGICKP